MHKTFSRSRKWLYRSPIRLKQVSKLNRSTRKKCRTPKWWILLRVRALWSPIRCRNSVLTSWWVNVVMPKNASTSTVMCAICADPTACIPQTRSNAKTTPRYHYYYDITQNLAINKSFFLFFSRRNVCWITRLIWRGHLPLPDLRKNAAASAWKPFGIKSPQPSSVLAFYPIARIAFVWTASAHGDRRSSLITKSFGN